ncbi:MAG: hypothetical protein IMZ62_19285 [Chloroflexi bacterium]|nr:hypothetical protein [Chloroflexota bacterium]
MQKKPGFQEKPGLDGPIFLIYYEPFCFECKRRKGQQKKPGFQEKTRFQRRVALKPDFWPKPGFFWLARKAPGGRQRVRRNQVFKKKPGFNEMIYLSLNL